MQKTITQLERFIEWTGRTVSWLTLAMVLVTFFIVVSRKLFDFGSIALQESVIYMHGVLFLVGAAYTLKQNAHVRVDILYQKFTPRTQAMIELLGTLVFLFPVMTFIIAISWEYVAESWSVFEASREAGGLPGVYLLKTFMILMATLIFLQGIVIMLRSVQILKQAGD